MNDRVNSFDDLSDFKPSQPKPISQAMKADLDQVADEHGFTSRQAAKPVEQPGPRQQRRRRTGRNQQINVKATAETVERFNRLADELDKPLGEVLEMLLKAFEATK